MPRPRQTEDMTRGSTGEASRDPLAGVDEPAVRPMEEEQYGVRAEKYKAELRHLDGCPVVSDKDLAYRMESWVDHRPQTNEPVLVVHCMECGAHEVHQ
jgi:hypothetical protein